MQWLPERGKCGVCTCTLIQLQTALTLQVDVTTEDEPGDLGKGAVRACIGGAFTLLGPDAAPAGGIAYVNTFGQDYFGPALVFSESLNGGNPREVASVISHGARCSQPPALHSNAAAF